MSSKEFIKIVALAHMTHKIWLLTENWYCKPKYWKFDKSTSRNLKQHWILNNFLIFLISFVPLKGQGNEFKSLPPILPIQQFFTFQPLNSWPVSTVSIYYRKFHSLLSQNLSTNMCKILNKDGRLFATHSLTYFRKE